MSHKCPGPGCEERVNDMGRLMCPAHWRLVPADQRRAFYATLRHGASPDEHLAAVRAAVKSVGGQP